jgi:hypothetical protein
MKTARTFGVLLLVTALSGCAATWARVDETNQSYRIEDCSVTLPAGWMQFKTKHGLILSKDGPGLQNILIGYLPHDKAFEDIGKQSSPTILPSELAEMSIALLTASAKGGLPSLTVVSNEPVEIAGKQGFGLHLSYKNAKGLRKDFLIQGFVSESGFYYVQYEAPTLFYFDRDRPAFESVARSFRL